MLYAISTVIYWAVDHSNVIYEKILDWNQPGLAIVTVVAIVFVVLPLVQLSLWAMFKLWCYVYDRKIAKYNDTVQKNDSQ